MKNNAKSIDVLQIFHITLRSVFYAYAYKFHNKKGKIFLKLDCTNKLVEIIASMGRFKKFCLKSFLNKIDVIGVEQKKLYEKLGYLLEDLAYKLAYIPNGIDYDNMPEDNYIDYNKRENVILNVSRIGSPEKATDVLLKAFSLVDLIKTNTWKLVLIGPVENGFENVLNNYFREFPELRDKIQIRGAIYDRKSLYAEYAKAKIFCLSSKFESFGIALLEGAAFGDIIISTDVGIASELVHMDRGAVVGIDDAEGLARAIETFISRGDLEQVSSQIRDLCRNDYNWDKIAADLYIRLVNT